MHPLTRNLRLVPARAAVYGLKHGVGFRRDLPPEVNEWDAHLLRPGGLSGFALVAAVAVGQHQHPSMRYALAKPPIADGVGVDAQLLGEFSNPTGSTDCNVECFHAAHSHTRESKSQPLVSVTCDLLSVMDTPAKRLKAARELRGMNQVQLASAAGVSTGTVGNIESGARGIERSARKLAKALNVNADWLATGEGHMELDQNLIRVSDNITPVLAVKMVPVLNKVNAGMFQDIVESHPEDIEYVPVYGMAKKYTFALRVEGDSMTPGFPNGCVVIVDPEVQAKPNDYVIAINGDNEATFKQLVKDGGDWYLKPRNPQWPIKPLGDAKIIGVVCGLQLQAKPGDDTWPT